MFVPFLVALGTAIMTIYGKKNISYAFWTILFIITLFTLYHHGTSLLNMSF
ncbi:DUF5993 family protein [Bartonella taylorii]|uniref:DUF5993 family protein n=1 Tax=Bartonella taylorii TaxID=33046 RepID=UPI002485C7F6|nr:DUF5993 family protein [Bartonella taylorii]